MLLDNILALALPKELIVILIGCLPIFELRGALPVAINFFGFPWYYALFLSILGNMLPVPFLLLFWDELSNFLARIGIFQRYLKWLSQRTRRQSFNIAEYKFIGLLVFVAVPAPFTGAWTASLIASVLRVKFWPAFMAIFGGVIVAGVIVTALSLLGWTGAAIAVIGLAVITVWSLRNNKSKTIESKPVQEKVKS